MEVCTHPKGVQQWLTPHRQQHQRIALVPTMGCLHAGHLKLIEQAHQHGDLVVVSIYVNPLQFGANEDLDRYPRPLEADLRACQDAGVDMVFAPANLYPHGQPQVMLHTETMANRLCGIHRTGHFDGVLTVVSILFHIIQPHYALFGEKDFQQLRLIKRMVDDLYMPVTIIPVATLREHDGLAMSSRNRYLSESERALAPAIFATLRSMQRLFCAGETSVNPLIQHGLKQLTSQNITPEYLEIVQNEDLCPPHKAHAACRIVIACKIGQTRLIDNLPIQSDNPIQSVGVQP
ncbi:MAG: pantoate--beta-alanine ligase [Zetaproteobacteria bacterium]|nr:pantoate--beta-alanine ligase [Zetaproteobacteria bacterium]